MEVLLLKIVIYYRLIVTFVIVMQYIFWIFNLLHYSLHYIMITP